MRLYVRGSDKTGGLCLHCLLFGVGGLESRQSLSTVSLEFGEVPSSGSPVMLACGSARVRACDSLRGHFRKVTADAHGGRSFPSAAILVSTEILDPHHTVTFQCHYVNAQYVVFLFATESETKEQIFLRCLLELTAWGQNDCCNKIKE